MAKAKQLNFQAKNFAKPDDRFGGALLKGNNPKTKRPLDTRLPTHLVLRAIKGGMRLPKTIREVNDIVEKTAKKHGVTLYKLGNSGNHLHLAIRVTRRMRWSGFIRELSGRIASLMRNLNITRPGESFWLHRPFTRIVRSWKKAYKDLLDYIELNILEAEGHISRKETKSLKELNLDWGEPNAKK